MADAETVDHAVERDCPPYLDGGEQIGRRDGAPAFLVAQLLQVRAVALGKREDIGRAFHRQVGIVEEEFDLLLAQPLDVEGPARNEMTQMLNALERTGELAGAAPYDALRTACRALADDRRLQFARTDGGEFKSLGVRR